MLVKRSEREAQRKLEIWDDVIRQGNLPRWRDRVEQGDAKFLEFPFPFIFDFMSRRKDGTNYTDTRRWLMSLRTGGTRAPRNFFTISKKLLLDYDDEGRNVVQRDAAANSWEKWRDQWILQSPNFVSRRSPTTKCSQSSRKQRVRKVITQSEPKRSWKIRYATLVKFSSATITT